MGRVAIARRAAQAAEGAGRCGAPPHAGYGTDEKQGDYWLVKNSCEWRAAGTYYHAAMPRNLKLNKFMLPPPVLPQRPAPSHVPAFTRAGSTYWGDGGYIKISRDNHGCGVVTDASYAVVEGGAA